MAYMKGGDIKGQMKIAIYWCKQSRSVIEWSQKCSWYTSSLYCRFGGRRQMPSQVNLSTTARDQTMN